MIFSNIRTKKKNAETHKRNILVGMHNFASGLLSRLGLVGARVRKLLLLLLLLLLIIVCTLSCGCLREHEWRWWLTHVSAH